MEDDALLRLNHLGLIPGPDENEEDFKKRAEYCLNLINQLVKEFDFSGIPDSEQDPVIIKQVAPLTKKLFDINVTWVPIVFSNHKLAPWHGGCAWIFQSTQETPTGAFFQLRKAFAKSSKYLGIYNRSEILAHEAAHVGRMMFQEPKFEELFAYRTSSSRFRRWLGPIVQSSWESVVFVIALFLTITVDFSGLLVEDLSYLRLFNVLPWLLLGLAFIRINLRHYQFSSCLKKLNELLKSSEKANALIYRLTDKEILSFGKMSLDEITLYIEKQRSLRWRVIQKAYL